MADDLSDLLGEDLASQMVGGQQSTALARFSDPGIMLRFIKATKNAPLDAIDEAIIGPAYAAMLWKFREAALNGNERQARSIKTWLDWAKPSISRPKREKVKELNKNSAAFGPREPEKAE